ncbi:hypothetical protein L1987_47070 [Smallanthus sonchifolius]|uniref:Uncharacterized protein n=1 Tax=Smallanthus sonchifolius TaxID=185202 RepID=A0ACB9G1C5_9ASTR|nr:hypothetical protein L1987_47070 [Smallanthus sonchifolius]
MRMSCNGCRVLRKGCTANCSIRPCLQWIKSPKSQANATVFLAKFYGRARFMNLINAGPQHLRPVGSFVRTRWRPFFKITQIASDTAEMNNGPPFKAYDFRHISKDDNSAGSNELHQVKTRGKIKRSVAKGKASRVWIGSREESSHNEHNNDLSSHESALSHQSEGVHVVESETEAEGKITPRADAWPRAG